MENLKKRWTLFFDVMCDPWNVLLILSVGILFYLSVNQANALASTLLFILITLASAVLGGRITKQWTDLTEGGIVVARGRSAVRSLKLLLRLVTGLEKRINEFRISESEIEKHPEVTKRNYEEVIESCRQLQEQTVNSIENWTDIVPEADIKSEIGVISELKDSLKAKEKDLAQLIQQSNEAEGKSAKELSDMQSQILIKEKQIVDLQRDIRNKDRMVGIGELGLLSVDSTQYLTEAGNKLAALAAGRKGSRFLGYGMVTAKDAQDKILTDVTPGTIAKVKEG